MIKINTLIAAYHFGNKLAKTSLGCTFLQRYNDLKMQLSPKAWLLYEDAINSCSFNHYYSFGLAYKKIEAVYSGKDEIFQDSLIELRNCESLKILINDGNEFGKDLENSLLQMFVRLPSENISKKIYSMELYRTWLDVFYQLHSTKLFIRLHQHKAMIENKQNNFHQFLESKDIYPYSRHNRLLIQHLAYEEKDKDIMHLLGYFDDIRNSVPQVIFDTHFDRSLKLNKNEIFAYKEKMRNQLRLYTIKYYGADVFRKSGNFLVLFDDKTLHDIGLIKKSITRNLELGDKSISTIEGLLYPRSDYHLFSPDSPES